VATLPPPEPVCPIPPTRARSPVPYAWQCGATPNWGRAVGAAGLAAGFAAALREELDLRVEARNMTSVAAASDGGYDGSDPGTVRGNPQALQPAGSVHHVSAPWVGPDKDFDIPIVPVQEHFLLLPHRPAHTVA
jgi:hypothetical protein